MKKSIILLLAACLCWTACSKDEVPPPVVQTEEEKIWWKGYFNGTFDGTLDEDDLSVSLVNNRSEQWIRTNAGVASWGPSHGDSENRLDILYGSILYREGEEQGWIYFSLGGLVPGTKHIVTTKVNPDKEPYNSAIELNRWYSEDAEPVRYVPSVHNPFLVKIYDVRWTDYSFYPGMEGEFHGVLYREDAPQRDSIAIDAEFSFR